MVAATSAIISFVNFQIYSRSTNLRILCRFYTTLAVLIFTTHSLYYLFIYFCYFLSISVRTLSIYIIFGHGYDGMHF